MFFTSVSIVFQRTGLSQTEQIVHGTQLCGVHLTADLPECACAGITVHCFLGKTFFSTRPLHDSWSVVAITHRSCWCLQHVIFARRKRDGRVNIQRTHHRIHGCSRIVEPQVQVLDIWAFLLTFERLASYTEMREVAVAVQCRLIPCPVLYKLAKCSSKIRFVLATDCP